MTSITSSVSSLINSILGLIQSLLNTIFSAFQSVFAVALTSVESVLDLVRGLFAFLLSNIVVIGLLAAAVVGFAMLQQRQGGKPIASGKKTS